MSETRICSAAVWLLGRHYDCRAPFWARGMRWQHCALLLISPCWKIVLDQPIDGPLAVRDPGSWLADTANRRPMLGIDASDLILGDVPPIANGQRIRSGLRYLGLWPRPVVNCTYPIRQALGLTGEIPDALYSELSGLRERRCVEIVRPPATPPGYFKVRSSILGRMAEPTDSEYPLLHSD